MMKTLDPALVAYALKNKPSERRQIADGAWLGLKIGAVLFFVLSAIELL